MSLDKSFLNTERVQSVASALAEDIGPGDVTAQLIDEQDESTATIITREDCVVCGVEWVDESFKQLGGLTKTEWLVKEGDTVPAGSTLVRLQGNTRILLIGERTALNFLQLLSGVATKASHYASLVAGTDIHILDTRKTLPGLRHAQKYAVQVGGCFNHRIALYDAFLIKENHISGCGSLTVAVERAKALYPELAIIVEVETIRELREVLRLPVDRVMLDNFSDKQLSAAAELKTSGIQYEVSGNVTPERVRELVQWQVDCISIGDLTKNVQCVDLSMGVEGLPDQSIY